jgi:hypothetical protein
MFHFYSARGRPNDLGLFSVSAPPTGYLFDEATRQGVSWRNYGEALSGTLRLPDADATSASIAQIDERRQSSDLGPPEGCYPNDTSLSFNRQTGAPIFDSTLPPNAPPNSESRVACFAKTLALQLQTGTVPAFNYMILPNDHTRGGVAGERTPRAMVADNDYALGQIVELISSSSIWGNTAIFVVEDDSQNGADHVDAHRIPALVISPYAPPGRVVHTRYDQLSVIRTIEIILGLEPLGLGDSLATPMYDAFYPFPSNSPRYRATYPLVDLLERNPKNGKYAKVDVGLEEVDPTPVPQEQLDRILWYSVHGDRVPPPAPGPNGNPGQ